MDVTRRGFLGTSATALLGALAAGCGSTAAATPTSPPTRASATRVAQAGGAMTVLVTNSELVVGRNRFTVALIGSDNAPVTDAKVKLEFFKVAGDQATKRADADAAFRWVDQPSKGVYAAPVEFPEAGDWGLQVLAEPPQGPAQRLRANFKVLGKGAAPAIGGAAPKSANPILSDVGGDATKLCTNAPPCNLHDLRIADALTAGKPTFILFATPGFCVSRTCAPMLGEVLKLRDRYTEQASFIHVEIYKDPQNRVVADTVNEWGLASEPWIFVVDRKGTVADRIEGTATLVELEASLEPLL